MLPRRDIALALGALIAAACSDSPTAPSPYPQVAGTYSGELSLRGEGISEILERTAGGGRMEPGCGSTAVVVAGALSWSGRTARDQCDAGTDCTAPRGGL